jgi:hypothetical protein
MMLYYTGDPNANGDQMKRSRVLRQLTGHMEQSERTKLYQGYNWWGKIKPKRGKNLVVTCRVFRRLRQVSRLRIHSKKWSVTCSVVWATAL